ncbi:hypothetical protein SAMN04488587_1072 [Methanococcoides vulcani]|uniref:Uncharacterized protein n=1 Tax=Methanococcoides vulcani TaxID=1353158 RepID=A0A1H9ZER7_9EURY|nr:hypothetical protein [Methanococcoides vulcani]SES80139.1 hypothetical protein SAMN04488587_1072 [Methanococcoides vulcani]
MKRVKLVVALLMVVAMLGCIPAAMAHQANCTETVNPHGKTVPPAGYSTLPGPKGGQNDDGFYNLSALAGPDIAWVNITVVDKGADNVYNTTDDTSFGPFLVNNSTKIHNTSYDFGLKIKYTEANGAEPSIKHMATFGKDNKGQSKAIEWHIKGQGDFAWVAEFYFEDGTLEGTVVTHCYVPPPPK